MRLSVQVDTLGAERRLDDATAAILLASTRTANRLLERAQTAGFREVDRIYGIGPRAYEKYVTVSLARDGELEARITVRGSGLPMYHFQPRQTKRGVTVRIKGKRVLIPHAFLGRMRSGHVGVFARGAYGGKGTKALKLSGESFGRFQFIKGSRKAQGRRRDGRGVRRTGLPVNELYTFAAPDALANDQVQDVMHETILDNIDKEMRSQLNFALRGR